MSAVLADLVKNGVPLTLANRHVPGNPNQSTIFRWYQRGVRGCKLKAYFVGGRLVTSPSLIAEFLASLNADLTESDASDQDADKERRAAETSQALSAFGI